MFTVAAIWYEVDQNAPSTPFLLNLDCSANPTMDELDRAIIDFFTGVCEQENKEYLENYDEPLYNFPLELSLEHSSDFGDIQICVKEDERYLFIGLPEGFTLI